MDYDVLEARGQKAEAERGYREALAAGDEPAILAPAAANLAGLLIRRGAPAEAVPLLRAAVLRQPLHAVSWNNLIVALLATGNAPEAAEALKEATALGVPISPELRDAVPDGAAP